ncbi:HNH endonuclease [Paraburkholderia sp. MPAMCS5]|uniref:HNH endonuclease n=1 Tax=Paraburkholderia sp. MPAMCS5 TaxID=3112563 RepID=UPI002E195750|nr:HNH endonuclease [Paraburkholderia sp. MPAMCS5]
MRCIFCKADSSDSQSVEHIIPESLWNTEQILPRRVVCDKCNNYFARNVEKPLLDSPALTHLRFHEAVPNKRGRIPEIDGLILPGHVVRMRRHVEGPFVASVALPPQAFDEILSGKSSTLVLPAETEPPAAQIVSRFLAKVAIEALAQRLLNFPGGLDYVIDEVCFDPIRKLARVGQPKAWPHHSRRIYDINHRWNDERGDNVQVVHEYDFLYTELGELYFVLALYGLELAINIGGPDVDGYRAWLAKSDGASPLYSGKNAPPSGE